MPKIVLDLTGKWEFKEYPLTARRMRDLESDDWHKTAIPCSVFSSLIAAGQIKQADINTNPEKFAWVSEKPWIYRKTFDVPAELLNCDRVDLSLDGLDTIASIWLNEKLIGRTNNMFIPFRFDVTKLVKSQNNSLLVKFEPAAEYAKKLMKRYTLFSSATGSELDFRNPYRIYIRKAQYQFGWDFCPSLPGCGIWRPVRLEGIKKARLDDIHIRTVDCNQQYADVKIAVKLDTVTKEKFLCRLNLSCDGQEIAHNLVFEPGEDFHSTVIRIESPSLWWPAGYGNQHLYQLGLVLLSGDEIIDRAQKRFGIRTVKLNRSPDEPPSRAKQNVCPECSRSDGERFRFEINGQPIFVRGANWVPATIFAGSLSSDDYRQLLSAAANCNMNMLRIWGGGYYETDEFYELCDRLGIMVWQDFMFACAYYPDQKWFTEEVKKEATKIIKQLRSHPCLVLWCGNNEIDWMHNEGRLGKNKKFYGKAIYHKLLPGLLCELDPDQNYIPTTPIGIGKDSNDPNSGTIHQWGIWSGHQPIRQYLCPPEEVPRFVTEFGLQSLPNMETIKSFCPSEQLRIGSQILEKHNYQLDGSSRLYRYMSDLFGTAENLERYVYLSQITQARAVKAYVEHLRTHNFRNSGVLFWQFNDCCPAISWSAIDSTYEPKALYYYTKRFFSKLLIVVLPQFRKVKADLPGELQSISVITINDTSEPVTATLNCRLIDLFGSLLDEVTFPVVTGPFSTSSPVQLPRAIVCPAHPDKSALHLLMEREGKRAAENLFFYLPDKYIDWPRAGISRRLSQIGRRQWKLKLSSSAVARDVQISTAVPAQFSDNFIDLVPPGEFEITIDCHRQVSSLELALKMNCRFTNESRKSNW